GPGCVGETLARQTRRRPRSTDVDHVRLMNSEDARHELERPLEFLSLGLHPLCGVGVVAVDLLDHGHGSLVVERPLHGRSARYRERDREAEGDLLARTT